jgi:glycosyltransferase involved in cell wall biosynthesis
MNSNEKTALIITTMNEIDGLRTVWNHIPFERFRRTLVIDGGSKDGTIEFLAEKKCEILTQSKPGRGNAIREAIEKITEDVIVLMSSDGNDDPRYIPDLLAKIAEGYDIVSGSRFVRGGRTDDTDDPLRLRRCGNRLFTTIVNLLWNWDYTDSTYGYRAFTREAWNKLKIEATKDETEFLMSIRAAKLDLKVCQIPMEEGVRVGGEVKARTLPTGWCFTKIIVRELFRHPY